MLLLLAKAISMSCVTICVCGLYMFCMCVHMYMLLCVYMFMKPRVWHQKCCPFSLCIRTPSWTCHSLIWLRRLAKQPQRSTSLHVTPPPSATIQIFTTTTGILRVLGIQTQIPMFARQANFTDWPISLAQAFFFAELDLIICSGTKYTQEGSYVLTSMFLPSDLPCLGVVLGTPSIYTIYFDSHFDS